MDSEDGTIDGIPLKIMGSEGMKYLFHSLFVVSAVATVTI